MPLEMKCTDHANGSAPASTSSSARPRLYVLRAVGYRCDGIAPLVHYGNCYRCTNFSLRSESGHAMLNTRELGHPSDRLAYREQFDVSALDYI